MIVYNVLNDICNDGYDIYVYNQDIEHLYQYLMSIKLVLYIKMSQI